MKKMTGIMLTVVMLIGLLVIGASASGFTFREEGFSVSGSHLVIGWNGSESADVVIDEVRMGSHICENPAVTAELIKADISALPAGRYAPIVYQYSVGAENKTYTSDHALIKAGTVDVSLTAQFGDNGTVTLRAIDANGMPVPNYQLDLQIGNMAIKRKTGANGAFTSTETAGSGGTVVFTGIETTVVATGSGTLTYKAVTSQTITRTVIATSTNPTTGVSTNATSATTGTGETTMTQNATTGTTVPPTASVNATTTAGTPSTYATITGTGTTSYENDKVALDVSLDENILSLFGLSQSSFQSKARLFLSKEDYSNIVGHSADMLMLNVLTSEKPATAAQVQTALANISKYSAYSEDNRQFMSFDLSFLILDENDGSIVPVSALPIKSTYLVRLPVPKAMQDCKMVAITLHDGDSLAEPQEVQVTDGCFQLEINSLETYTLIGFGTGGASKAGGLSWWLVLLLAAGILLLVGAAVLLYLFVFRKPAAVAPVTEESSGIAKEEIVLPPDDDTDIFSGRTDLPKKNP